MLSVPLARAKRPRPATVRRVRPVSRFCNLLAQHPLRLQVAACAGISQNSACQRRRSESRPNSFVVFTALQWLSDMVVSYAGDCVQAGPGAFNTRPAPLGKSYLQQRPRRNSASDFPAAAAFFRSRASSAAVSRRATAVRRLSPAASGGRPPACLREVLGLGSWVLVRAFRPPPSGFRLVFILPPSSFLLGCPRPRAGSPLPATPRRSARRVAAHNSSTASASASFAPGEAARRRATRPVPSISHFSSRPSRRIASATSAHSDCQEDSSRIRPLAASQTAQGLVAAEPQRLDLQPAAHLPPAGPHVGAVDRRRNVLGVLRRQSSSLTCWS